MTSLRIRSTLLFSLLTAGAILQGPQAAEALPTAAPAAPVAGGMVMTARETPEAACAKGDAAACTVAALRALPSKKDAPGSAKAADEARTYFEKGCEKGDPEGCRHLGLLLKTDGRLQGGS